MEKPKPPPPPTPPKVDAFSRVHEKWKARALEKARRSVHGYMREPIHPLALLWPRRSSRK